MKIFSETMQLEKKLTGIRKHLRVIKRIHKFIGHLLSFRKKYHKAVRDNGVVTIHVCWFITCRT